MPVIDPGPILSFQREFRFLSNFWPAEVTLRGIKAKTVEHAYQAAKVSDEDMFESIMTCGSPGKAKRLGRGCELRPDWEDIKEAVMLSLLMQKFQDSELENRLAQTGNRKLVEGNSWGDIYWGQVAGKGKNRLGILLMFVREFQCRE